MSDERRGAGVIPGGLGISRRHWRESAEGAAGLEWLRQAQLREDERRRKRWRETPIEFDSKGRLIVKPLRDR